MSVVKMNRISMMGLEKNKEQILEHLMQFGMVELIDTDLSQEDALSQWVVKDESQADVTELEDQISKVRFALDALAQYDKSKKPLFASKRVVDTASFHQIVDNSQEVWDIVEQISGFGSRLSELRAEENRLRNVMASLEPWKPLNVPLDLSSTRYTRILLGVVPSVADISKLTGELFDQIAESYIRVISSDREQSYLFVVYYRDCEEGVLNILKAYGFTRMSFKDLAGTAQDSIRQFTQRIEEIALERVEIERSILELSGTREKLEILHDDLVMKRDRKKAAGTLLKTEKVFLLEGWLPERESKNVEELLSRFDCFIEIRVPTEDEECPTLLENNRLGASVESITQMYSTPNYREIDPNTIMAPFFILFFGLMLGDGGYGLTMMIVAGFALWKLKLDGGMRRFMRLMLFCGISTTFWGALFGGWFGIEFLGEFPLWFNPVKDPEELLKWSLVFGVIHIFVGIGVRGANLIRQKKYLDVVFDVLTWYVFFTGFVLYVLPYVPKVNPSEVTHLVELGEKLLLVGGASLILTQGREHKNIFRKLLGGLSSLYDLISFMSDVLSYSRLLALGLATSVIASIINEMGAMGGLNSFLKILIFIIVMIVGHTFNFSINALGAYVHSCRLQYIEFFGKFYKGGGKNFEPLKMDTKYISIKN